MGKTVVNPTTDSGSKPRTPLHNFIAGINHPDAKSFIETWHYSKRMPTGKNINYGLYVGGTLYAVIVYGIGVNPYQAKFLGVGSVIEIKRMARSEPKKNYPLSKFISISTRLCRKVFPFDAIVAFADPEQGHEGGVYKASGFMHAGMTNPEFHLVAAEGTIRHRRYAYRYAKRNGISVGEARKILNLERIKTKPKHRWVRRIG